MYGIGLGLTSKADDDKERARRAGGPLDLHGVDLTHARLPELAKLADAAKPFYDWVESKAQELADNGATLHENLQRLDLEEIRDLLRLCYQAGDEPGVPVLVDGIGRQY
ncbi:MAG TPA: hypothetical protein VF214_06490, partial [Edaphobacter sp.]